MNYIKTTQHEAETRYTMAQNFYQMAVTTDHAHVAATNYVLAAIESLDVLYFSEFGERPDWANVHTIEDLGNKIPEKAKTTIPTIINAKKYADWVQTNPTVEELNSIIQATRHLIDEATMILEN